MNNKLKTMNELPFQIGQMVYLITDPEQSPRIVTEIMIGGYGVKYGLNLGSLYSEHYEYEMQEEINNNIKLGLN